MTGDSVALCPVKIRLEACSFSLNRRNASLLQTIRDSHSTGATLKAVVGRVVTSLSADQTGLLRDIEVGGRLCCVVNLAVSTSGGLPGEMEVLPYTACSVPPDVDPANVAACLVPAIRIYTALHTLARVRKGESVLIACPNDLNFTCIAMQICDMLHLKAFAFVSDDGAAAATCKFASNKNVLMLDSVDAITISSACDAYTGGLGFDCILDLNNDTSVLSGSVAVTFSRLVRLLAAFGRIVTDRKEDPIPATDVSVLHMKSSSAHFLFDQVWELSPLHHGRYMHMISDIVNQVRDEKLRPVIGFRTSSTKIDEASAKHDDKVGCTILTF